MPYFSALRSRHGPGKCLHLGHGLLDAACDLNRHEVNGSYLIEIGRPACVWTRRSTRELRSKLGAGTDQTISHPLQKPK